MGSGTGNRRGHRGVAGRIAEVARQRAGGRKIVHARIGIRYTAVQLDDGACGLALTELRRPDPTECKDDTPLLPGALKKPLERLLDGLCGGDPLQRSIALATANAILNGAHAEHEQGDVLDMLELRPEDRLAMVGCFWPLLEQARDSVAEVVVLEQIDKPHDFMLPASRANDVLPSSQVAIITATAIVNDTIDGLLELCTGCRQVAIVGPSTPLAPEAFSQTPVTHLCGSLVEEPEQVMEIVATGGGMRAFKGHLRKLCVEVQGKR
ncbi:MAG: hypothetical protein D6806_02525 [Deltaproteobacteria bacterium]|nr:MAG: hypothetical protein D6806_02525 [Deltaproteobacteria bacterium]